MIFFGDDDEFMNNDYTICIWEVNILRYMYLLMVCGLIRDHHHC